MIDIASVKEGKGVFASKMFRNSLAQCQHLISLKNEQQPETEHTPMDCALSAQTKLINNQSKLEYSRHFPYYFPPIFKLWKENHPLRKIQVFCLKIHEFRNPTRKSKERERESPWFCRKFREEAPDFPWFFKIFQDH